MWTPQDPVAYHDEADLRAAYRLACLRAFVECADDAVRRGLARRVSLDESDYEPHAHAMVAEARRRQGLSQGLSRGPATP